MLPLIRNGVRTLLDTFVYEWIQPETLSCISAGESNDDQ